MGSADAVTWLVWLELSCMAKHFVGDRYNFLIKFTSSGRRIWTKLVGLTGWDETRGISLDSTGAVYVCGCASASYYATSYRVHLPANRSSNLGSYN
ncbi:hypothetical protein EON65_18165 [archaeon]|nr:MAG: hypothetical protein EON65_18165 [archaeon]